MADEQEVTIKITTDANLSDAETLEDLIDQLRDKASDIPLDFNESPAEEDVNGLQDSLDGLSALAVGETLQQYGASAENLAQQMNEASISVGQLATQTGIAEPQMVNLINNISNATFPNDEAMMYVKSLDQIGVSSDKLGQSATDLDKINDAFGLGAAKTNSMGQELSVLGVDMNNVSSSFNALAYANANTVGGMENFYSFLRKYDAQFNQLGLDVDQSAVIIAAATQKYGGGRAALSGLSDALKQSGGDARALEQALGLQNGALDKATQLTGKYDGQLQQLANEEAEHKTLLDQLGAAWEDLSLSIGNIASPIMGVVGLGGQVAGFGAQLNGTWELLSKLGNIGGISAGFSGITSAISGAGSSLLAFATGPVGIVIAAIIALGVAVYEVGKYFGWWKDLPGMFSAIQTGIGELWNAFMSNEYVIQAIDLIKQGLTDAWNAIVGFGQAIMSALGGAGGQFDILAWAINGLQMVLNAVGPVVIMAIQGIIQYFRNIYTAAQIVWPYIANAIQGAIGVVTGIINGARAVFQGLIGVWNSVSSAVGSMCSAITGGLSAAGAAWEGFKNMVMAAAQPILDVVHQIQSVGGDIWKIMTGGGSGGIETPTVNTSYGSGGYTTVSQGNTIIFNMYGDIRDERTLDETIDAINNRIQFDALANGIGDNGSGAI